MRDTSSTRPSRVLICAYACLQDPSIKLPGGGDLMAWNMVTRLARSFQVWVLTSDLNQPVIEAAMRRETHPDLHFCYVGLPDWLRMLYRLPGGYQLCAYLWQWRALFAARRLHHRVKFDAFHHLTYENDWMASPTGAFLPVPYLRGPGGGAHRTPREFVKRYPLRGRLWERFRAAGQWVLRRDPVFLLGQQRARAILVCNREALEAIPARWRSKARLFPVNGVSQEVFARRPAQARAEKKFTVLSAGRLVRLKAFDLAIK
ncbi:MAG TPA: hypothetical protein VFJ52_00950, partial [Terriglobia bacterium]|nr:hypothetical protein [Terriglobia bacterium]